MRKLRGVGLRIMKCIPKVWLTEMLCNDIKKNVLEKRKYRTSQIEDGIEVFKEGETRGCQTPKKRTPHWHQHQRYFPLPTNMKKTP